MKSIVFLLCCTVLGAPGLISCNESQKSDGGDSEDTAADSGPDPDTDSETDTAEGCPVEVAPSKDLVITAFGAVRGFAAGDSTAFLGIPFARPPLGSLRFAPPEETDCFDGIFEAQTYGPICPQLTQETEEYQGEEDCLTLNIWTPATLPASERLPVLFFIHGGGNAIGSAAETTLGLHHYDGNDLAAATGAVVATIQYRLGPLGWLVHPQLDEESAHGGSGNYGLLDQIAALKWVQNNIAGFGGDPARVMIFGESAGAVDTCMLLVSPLAHGLFSAALMQSGGCPGYSAEIVGETGAELAEASGCNDTPDPLACLRSLSPKELLEALPPDINVAGVSATHYQPNVDGWALPADPLTLMAQGAHNKVPFVVGANSDETARYVPLSLTEPQYDAMVKGMFASLADEVLEQYPAADYDNPYKAYVQLSTDAKFVCPARKIARSADAGQEQPVYRYFFTQSSGAAQTDQFGAFHGLEIMFVFGHLDDIAGFTPTAEQLLLSETMMAYWHGLAATGEPSGAGAPKWSAYVSADDDTIVLQGGDIHMQNGIRPDKCDFWDSIFKSGRTTCY